MPKPPLFSKLKHHVIFLENVNPEQLGGEAWQEKFSTYAEVKPLFDNKVSSLESFDFGHIVTEGYFIFTIRAILGINIKMRINNKNRLFEIKRILDVEEEGRILKIVALEI